MSNKYEEYFGKALVLDKRADDNLSHETYNLPKAYEGKNKHLEDVLDFMIRKEDEFYTSRLLPWSFTDELHVQWEIFRFNRTLMDVEPEQGIPRLVTAETERRSDNLLRRGLAFIIEHGFMTTDRGRRHFMMNLQQITDSVHTTAYYGVMHALLSTKQHYKSWLRETDRASKRPRNLLRHERNNWACVQKSHKGLYVLDAELKHQMKKNNIVPNVWVFPPKMSIYLDMAPQEQTEYRLKGPQAAGNLEEDRSQKAIHWRGTEVFEAATFDIDFVNDDHDLLQRTRQCGEFFVIPAGTKSIKIFSADHDDFMTIDYSDAWSHALNKDYYQSEGENLFDQSVGGIQYGLGVGPYIKKDTETISLGVGPNSFQHFEKKVGALITSAFNKQIEPKIKEARKSSKSKDPTTRTGTEKDLNGFKKDQQRYTRGREQCLQLFNQVTQGDGKKVTLTGLRDTIYGNENTNTIGLVDKEEENLWCCTENEAIGHVNKRLNRMSTSKEGEDYLELYQLLFGLWFVDELREMKRQEDYKDSRLEKDILIFRPFQTYRMSSAILAAGGKDLGETFHGHHDFQLSDDIIRKVHVGHYTHYSKSVVKQPKRYAIAEDVFAQGYVSGEGVDFFDKDTLGTALGGDVATPDCRQSLIAWAINPGSVKDKTVLDMRGKFSDQYSDYGEGESQFDGCTELEQMLNEKQLTPQEGQQDDIFLSTTYYDNTLCFRGTQYTLKKIVDKKDAMHYRLTSRGHGHWKGLTYSGCMSVREGTVISPTDTALPLSIAK